MRRKNSVWRLAPGCLALVLPATGCIIVDESGGSGYPSPTPALERPPFIEDVQVVAGYDDYYDECYWDFYAWVQDPDGVMDIEGVTVSILDDYQDDFGVVVESFDLVPDDGEQWSNTVYQTYAGNANCSYAGYYAYLFEAYDWAGAYDAVTVEPEPVANAWPYFLDATVEAGFDEVYDQCFWNFFAWVDDPDGVEDIDTVYVDVVDLEDPDIITERFYLADDGEGQWSDTIYADYAGAADCNRPDAYVFDFWVFDSAGNHDRLTP